MSQLSISSPGVQINELDLSIISRPIGSTDVLTIGFAPQGPTEELVNIGSVSEFESVFGTPTNAAERYLYYTARQILSQSPANLYITRLPYGSGIGDGYGNSYSALVYPISSNDVTTYVNGVTSLDLTNNNEVWDGVPTVVFLSGGLDGTTPNDPALAHVELDVNTNSISALVLDYSGTGYVTVPTVAISGTLVSGEASVIVANLGVISEVVGSYTNSTEFALGAPVSLLLSEAEYDTLVSNNINWVENYDANSSQINSFADIGKAGLIVINDSKSVNNSLYEGYYLTVSDNSNVNIATNFDAITSIKAVNGTVQNYNTVQNFVTVPESRLNFNLTQPASGYYGIDSLSKIVEQFPLSFNFGLSSFSDSLVITLFKIKATRYNQDTVQLDYSVAESYVGSLNANRTQNNPKGGTPISFFLDTVVNNKSNNIKVITNPYISQTGKWTLDNGYPAKEVKVSNAAKSAFSQGVYSNTSTLNSQDLGQVDQKLARVLTTLSNDDTTNIDVIVDGGLSTIWTTAYTNQADNDTPTYTFDETYSPSDIDSVNGLGNTKVNTVPTGDTIEAYKAITEQFVAYAESRRDHVFISDPLRQIFVRGQNGVISKRKSYNFATQTYWPLNNIYGSIQSSYVATYGNWIQADDIWSSKPVWIPASGYAAAVIARSSQSTFPWIAPAGFNRGTLTNVLDLGVNPTQHNRDQLYKINVNPIAFFNQDGFVIMGQKTMYRKPSAFDRLNVRRLFLTLEKETQRLLKFYVFEPNDFATRNRLKAALTPIFDQAKLNDGCYDYLIVCDTTNNTPDIIDSNQLKIAIYIQPVRAAEFILADFIATTTGVNFSELIRGGQS